MHFFIKGITEKGKTAYSFSEADDYNQLLKNLQQQNTIALSITQLHPLIALLIPKFGNNISASEIVELMENLHLVIKSGLPLHQGLMDLAEDSDSKRFKEMLLYIATSVHDGKSLSVAFQKYEMVVGSIILNLIKIGEET